LALGYNLILVADEVN